jgi:transposase-like protein
LLAVRAVVDFEMSQADAAAQYGVSHNTMSQWVSLYREQGEAMKHGGASLAPLGTFEGRVPEAAIALVDERQVAIREDAFVVEINDAEPASG